MGSFYWDYRPSDHVYMQYHNGRPLSAALVEPDETVVFDGYFMLHPSHQRSRSLGRRYYRETFSVHHPTQRFSFVPTHHCSTGDMFLERLERVTVEDNFQPRVHVRACSPMIRQLKIRSRPVSSFNLERESFDQRDSNYVEEHYEESFYRQKFPEKVIPIQRYSPISVKTDVHDATTSTDDLQQRPAPRRTRDVGTPTANLPQRPLSRSETQICERYEQDVKVRGDSVSLTESNSSIKQTPVQQQSFNDIRTLETSTTTQTHQEELVERVDYNYTTSWRPLAIYSDHRNTDLIVRPTAKPREALVDTASIVGSPRDAASSSTSSKYKFESSSSYAPRISYFST